MNKLAVGIISGVVGCGAGVAVGIFGTREYWRHIYLDKVEVEVDSVRRHFRANKKERKVESHSEDDEDVEEATDDIEDAESEEEPEESGKYWKRAGRYWGGVNDRKPSLDELGERVKEAKKNEEGPPNFPDPYMITEEEFIENPLGHEQKSVRYHFGDQTVVDDETDEILDIRTSIGFDAIDAFEDDVVYVRNEKTSTDYEVVGYEESYAAYSMNYYNEYDDKTAGMKTRDRVREGAKPNKKMRKEEDDD